jgi:uncharacterized membrane protein
MRGSSSENPYKEDAMATLSAIKFPTPTGADQALSKLKNLQQQQLITVHDAAVVSWPAGKKHPVTKQGTNLVGAGALGGTFWGLLFGLIFFVPILGMAIGATIGAISGAMADVGIDDEFINTVRDQVTPGTSALFLLSSGAVTDRVAEAFKGQEMEVISTNLSKEAEANLKKTFESSAAA